MAYCALGVGVGSERRPDLLQGSQEAWEGGRGLGKVDSNSTERGTGACGAVVHSLTPQGLQGGVPGHKGVSILMLTHSGDGEGPVTPEP